MTEAEFLAALRTLPLHPGAQELRDDTARLGELILTTDAIVEGVHYLAGDLAEDVAWKLVAVNLSDLAAKGATPEGVLLNYPLGAPALPAHPHPSAPSALPPSPIGRGKGPAAEGGGKGEGDPANGWDAAFLAGLGQTLSRFACTLLGGDTVSLPAGAPRVISLTAIGRAAAAPLRSGALPDDALYVTGTIGDAGAGLRIALGEDGPAELLAAYRRPQPRLAEGRALAPVVHAMMDVSDGLLIDAARMAEASGVGVTIDLAAIPLSSAYCAFAGDERAARLAAATAGDDYQLLFAAPADLALPAPATRVGTIVAGAGLTLTDNGTPLPLPDRLGFAHGD